MNAQQTYLKFLNKEITEKDFAYHMRRNPMLKEYITPISSVNDIISILKNKGVIWEESTEEHKKGFDAFAAFKNYVTTPIIKESVGAEALEPKKKKLTADQVNYYEFTMGWRWEYQNTPSIKKDQDIDKAKEIALRNLNKDPMYYSAKIFGDTFKKQGEDAKHNSKKILKQKSQKVQTSLNDKKNAMKAIKDADMSKKNVKDNLGKQERAKGNPKGVKVMKLKESIKASVKKLLHESSEYKSFLRKKKVNEDTGWEDRNLPKKAELFIKHAGNKEKALKLLDQKIEDYKKKGDKEGMMAYKKIRQILMGSDNVDVSRDSFDYPFSANEDSPINTTDDTVGIENTKEEFQDNTAPEKVDSSVGSEIEFEAKQTVSKAKPEEGKMHKILGVKPGESIKDKFKSGEDLYKSLHSKLKDHKKVAQMLAYAANISSEKDVFDAALRYAKEHNPNKEETSTFYDALDKAVDNISKDPKKKKDEK